MSNVGYIRSFRAGLSILTGLVLTLVICTAAAGDFLNDIVINSAKIQIVLSPINFNNHVNISTTFTNNGDPGCAGDDALNDGFQVYLFPGGCPTSPDFSNFVEIPLPGFVPHTIGHKTYGTFYEAAPGVFTISAKLTVLPTLTGVCGHWGLDLEGTGAELTSGFHVGDSLAVLIVDEDHHAGCLDVPAIDTIIGNSIR